jgi:hypothetical protein
MLIKAIPTDSDCDYKKIWFTLVYEAGVSECLSTTANPSSINVDNGVFTITCDGTNITSYKVKVE